MSLFHKSKSILVLVIISLLVLTTASIADLQLTAEESTSPDPVNPVLILNGGILPQDSTFTVEGAFLETNGTYSCINGDVITIKYVPGSGISCVDSWGYSKGEGSNITILKETAFVLMFSLSGDETITPSFTTTDITKVSTWSEMIAAFGEGGTCTTIVVDTGGSLARMDTNPLIINRSVRIVGDNSTGKNGFIRGASTIENEVVVPTIQITGGTVYMTGVTFDGGATWNNSSDDDLHKMIQNVLQRGDSNSGVKTDKPFISNVGSLYLQDDLIIQNAYNTYESSDSSNNGGALYSGGYVSFEGVLIKDCFALRGSAAYCIMEGDKKLVIKGNTMITHNGGLNCELGSAIYVWKGQLEIQSGKINENYGAFTFACGEDATVEGGEICRNVSKAAQQSHCSSQDKYCGVFYMFGSSSIFSMKGGYIMENKTYRTGDSSGLYSGIVFQSSSNLTMSGGTICDNIVYKGFSISGNDVIWTNKAYGCDVKFGAQGGTGAVTMTGGSLEAVLSSSNVTTKVIVKESGDNKSGIIVTGLKGSDDIPITWSCKDVVTDADGCIYVLRTDVKSVDVEELIQLVGKPVIGGNPIADNTLKVIYSPSNYTCKWYIKETPESEPALISNHTTYVVKTDDFGKQIFVVITGTNGYKGNLVSEPVKVCIQFVIEYNCAGSDSTILNSSFNYSVGDIVQLTKDIPLWQDNIKHFVGWSCSDTHKYAPGADFDPLPFFTNGNKMVTMDATWEDRPVEVYCDQGKVVKMNGNRCVIYDIPEAPVGKVFVGWSCDGTMYATGQPLESSSVVRHFEAVFIDETYHGTLIIGPVQA